MPRTALKQFNLSDSEIQVYIVCLSLGNQLVSTIAKKCGLKRTSAYSIIEKLTKKGFLTSFTKNNMKYYSALDTEVLLEKSKLKISESQNNLKKIENALPFLNNLLDKNKNKSKVEYFEGFEGLKSMYEDVIKVPFTHIEFESED